MTQTKIVILTQQDENWEDDGGDHDCYVISVDDSTFNELKKWDEDGDPRPKNEFETLTKGAVLIGKDTFPMTVHGVFNIWTCYS